MKPNFALILSMEGIALLKRSSPGWELVGEVSPESPTLAKEMKALRRAAERLSTGRTFFKIVIPNDQIRYVTVPAGPADPRARQQAVERALDGQTPYALDELITDCTVSAGNLQIAAVALETLQEADEFARSFGFNPVSFAAMPETRDYSGEPFFGTAHDVPENITIEPDLMPIRVSGRIRANLSEPTPEMPVEPETPVPAPSPAPSLDDKMAADTPDSAAADAPADEPPVAFVSRRSTDGVAPAAPAPTTAPKPDSAPKSEGLRASRGDTGQASPAPSIAAPSSAPEPASGPMFQHVARGGDLTPPQTDFQSPAAEGVTADAPAKSSRGAKLTALTGGAAMALGAVAGQLGKLGQLRGKLRRPKAEPTLDLPETAGISLTGDDTAFGDAAQDVAITTAVEEPPAPKPAKKSRRKKAAKPAPEPTPIPDMPPEVVDDIVLSSGMSKRALGELSADERKKEAERLTVFGARGGVTYQPSNGGASMALGVVAAVFLLGTAGWAAIFMSDGMAPLVSPVETPDDTTAAITDEAVPPGDGEDIEDVSPLIVTEAVDAAEAADAAPDAADEVLPQAETEAEAEARYAATGIWPDSPDPLDADALGSDRTDNGGSASAEGPPTRMDQVALAALTPDALPTPPGPPPTPGQRFNLDDRGLVIATPEGVLSPQGVPVFAGDPPILPPARPGQEPVETPTEDATQQGAVAPAETPVENPAASEAVADTQTAPQEDVDVVVIEGSPPLEPPTRPPGTQTAQPDTEGETPATTDTEPQTEVTQDDPASDDQADTGPRPEPRFAALRPLIRPFATPDTDEVQLAAAASGNAGPAAGASLAQGAIESAVAAALVPNDQPASAAAGLVTAAAVVAPQPQLEPSFPAVRPKERPDNIAQLAAAAVVRQEPPPAVVPRVPSSASVTRQATVRNAINLNRINLIGVYGQPSDRRALVRLANGRYRKVQVGDRIDGGRVVAIGDGNLRYQKNGRNVTLDMPSG